MQIIFDFDGVIINSHKIKSAAFFKIFKIYGENVGLSALNYHIKNIGKSRYQKFRFIYEKFLRKKFTKKELIKIDKAFEEFTVVLLRRHERNKYMQRRYYRRTYQPHPRRLLTPAERAERKRQYARRRYQRLKAQRALARANQQD